MAQPESAPVTPAARADGRGPDQLRPVRFQNDVAPYATGSTLIEWGNTRVICGVTVEETVPRWMKEQGVTGGWITAEYSMLPYSTLQRKQRDITKGKIDGRSQEIQRLIGRAMRAAIDLEKLGTRTIWVDCDVLQADGGTRTAAITGAYVALALAMRKLVAEGKLPAESHAARRRGGQRRHRASSRPCWIFATRKTRRPTVDLNLVMNSAGEFIELQGTGEEATFSEAQLAEMLALGKAGVEELLAAPAGCPGRLSEPVKYLPSDLEQPEAEETPHAADAALDRVAFILFGFLSAIRQALGRRRDPGRAEPPGGAAQGLHHPVPAGVLQGAHGAHSRRGRGHA